MSRRPIPQSALLALLVGLALPFLTASDGSAGLAPLAIADLAVTVSVDNPTPQEGSLVNFFVTLDNNGPGDVSGIVVTDVLPAGLTLDRASTGAGFYQPLSGEWSVSELDAGASVGLVLSVTVDAGTSGTRITNTASITASDATDLNVFNDSDSASIDVSSSKMVVVSGSYVGTGVDSLTVTGTGFLPSVVLIKGEASTAPIIASDTMPAGVAKPIGPSDAAAVDLVHSLDADGFTVGTDPAVNSLGVTYHWTAWRTGPSVASGTYVGDATDNRDITGAGFQPEYVALWSETNFRALQRFGSQAGDASLRYEGEATAANRIQSLQADGFQVGSDNTVNDTGKIYHWVAWAGGSGLTTGFYLGDGLNGRSITGTGFPPALVILASEAGHGTVHRPPTVPGDATLPFYSDGVFGNAIESLEADGFTLGTEIRANSPANVYHWAAFSGGGSALLTVTGTADDTNPLEGQIVQLQVSIANQGPNVATNLRLRDAWPAGTTLKGHAVSAGSFDDKLGDWTLASLGVGEVDTLVLDLEILPGTAGSTLTNVASLVARDQVDPDGSDDAAITELVVQSTDVAVSIDVDNLTPATGDTIQFTITAKNLGPFDTTDLVVDIDLPSELSDVAEAPEQGTYSGNNWDIGAVAVGDSVRMTLWQEVKSGAAGETFATEVLAETVVPQDPDPSNDFDSVSVTVPASDIEVSKSADRSFAAVGDTVRFTVRVTNLGPEVVTALTVTDNLPASLTHVSHSTTSGSFDPGTGVWDVGGVALGDSSLLVLDAEIAPGTAGTVVTNVATRTSQTPEDHESDNDSDQASVFVGVAVPDAASLSLTSGVDDPTPVEGQTVRISLSLDNRGPDAGTNVRVRNTLPGGVTLQTATPSHGTFDAGTGHWDLASIEADSLATLDLDVQIQAGTGGSTLTNLATIAARDQGDPNPSDDSTVLEIDVQGVDIAVTKSVDDSTPRPGDTVRFTITALNRGPDPTTVLEVTDLLPAGLTYAGDIPERGTYNPGTGVWDIGALTVGEQLTLLLDADVEASAAGTLVTNEASLTASTPGDVDGSNDSDDATLFVGVVVQPGSVEVFPGAQSPTTVVPGATPTEVFRVHIHNNSAAGQTLDSLTLENVTNGPGTQGQLDASWSALRLVSTRKPAVEIEGSMASGEVVFADIALDIPRDSTRTVVVLAGASVAARDGDRLDLLLRDASDVEFKTSPTVAGNFPLDPAGDFLVDGMGSAQISVTSLANSSFLSGSTHNLALDVVVPSNGYESDTLTKINVVNLGSAQSGVDVTRMEVWRDNGDGAFDPAGDTLLGQFLDTGSRWETTSLSEPIPADGQRFFVTADIADLATPGRTIRLALPGPTDPAFGLQSGNSGPIDTGVASPTAQVIAVSERITFTANPTGGTVHPGEGEVVLLDLVASNTYDDARTLTSLRVSNASTGLGNQGELDSSLDAVFLRADGNGNGLLDPVDVDPLLATTSFSAGQAFVDGLGWSIPAGGSQHLFVVGRVSSQFAADGDILAASLDTALDVGFAEAVTVAASWPVTNPDAWTVDGMKAQQIDNRGAPVSTVGPGEGPVLALDVVVPANGYADDTLNGFFVENLGTATDADLSDLQLWRDGGNGLFEAGGDDTLLGSLTWTAGGWQSPFLSEPLSGTGARLFVGMTVDANPAHGATVQLAIPENGLTVASGNDGPYDAAVANPDAQLISTAPLLASLEVVPGVSTVGQTVTVRMDLRNAGGETIESITPSALTLTGTGTLSLLTGPTPPTLDLPPDGEGSITWTWSTDAPGTARFSGDASGWGNPSGIQRLALPSESNEHEIFLQADSLELVPVASADFTVNRGQTAVVPLSLTLENPGGSQGSDILLNSMRVRVEDSGGAGLVPADLFSRVVVAEGTRIYLDKTSLESSGDEIDLTLAVPVRATGNEPVTLNLQFDVSAATTETEFRVAILTGGWFAATDATSGAPVTVDLAGASYPVVSGLASVQAEATELQVTARPTPDRTVGPGQPDVDLLDFRLENPGVTGLTSDVRVGAFVVSLGDTLGNALHQPDSILASLEVRVGAQQFLARSLGTGDSSRIVLELSPPIDVAVNTPLDVTIRGQFAPESPSGAVRLSLVEPGAFEATDPNSQQPIPVTFTPDPIPGANLEVQQEATISEIAGTPAFPTVAPVGAAGVRALDLTLHHPDGPGTGAIRVDGLLLYCADDAGTALVPADLLDRLVVEWNGTPVADVTGLPTSAVPIPIPLPGVVLAPGETATLALTVDLEATAPSGFLELSLRADGLTAVDVNTTGAITLQPAAGVELPLRSGLVRLQPPAQQLLVDADDTMPVLILPGQAEVPALSIHMENSATAGASDIVVDRFVIDIADATSQPLDPALAVQSLSLWEDGAEVPLASATPGATSIELVFTTALGIPAQSDRTLDLRLDVDPDATVAGLRLGLAASGLGIVQPPDALLTVRADPAPGKSFPFWTAAASLSPTDL